MALGLFEGFGVELEYMIVQKDSLKVFPVADKVLKAFAGTYIDEVENGSISWSNELALHVIELKTNGPAPSLNSLSQQFSENIKQINALLKPLGGILMPTAMHPFMDPFSEMHLWPHERNEIYEKYNAIFDCRGHGWANLQSVHINLPFSGDEEFAWLHAAIRLILPILPALAASSPVKDSSITGLKDTRLDVYQSNQKKIPSIAGKVIPEPVYTQKDYVEKILQRNYRDIAPYDPEGILQDEWLNSRGAIARFQRNAIEIRVLDIQECPAADLAILKLIVSVIRNLVEEKWGSLESQKNWGVDSLYDIFKLCVHKAEDAVIDNPQYLHALGYKGDGVKASELWQYLAEQSDVLEKEERDIIKMIGIEGTLASRILSSLGENPSHDKLLKVYQQLVECLEENKVFKVPIS